MISILSTKKLKIAQRNLLLGAGFGLVDYEGIKIELKDVDWYQDVNNAIVTSKNAVKAIQGSGLRIQNFFCVGENTKKLLEENGQNVVRADINASLLAKAIVENYKKESFVFFCGNMRRDELPTILNNHKVTLEEKIVYNTIVNKRTFHRNFDGILFFSPSGVQSYVAANSIVATIVFCIGNTTASEAKKYTDTTIIVANKPTVENVIVQAVKYFDKRI